jgi:hypothetical protein
MKDSILEYVKITVGYEAAMGARYEKTKRVDAEKFKKLKISEIRQIVKDLEDSGWSDDNQKYDN